MQIAPVPGNASESLDAVHRLGILDTEPEARFDDLTKQAVDQFHVQMCIISIIDKDREWYKSCQGVSKRQQGRDISFCGHALLAENIFIVEDTLNDPRFADNPSVVGAPFIRFYAGIALYDQKTKLPIGVFCIKDIRPRKMSIDDVALLMDYASKAENELNRE